MMNNYSEVPNGGFGYVVVIGAMVINATNQAVVSIFGLLFGPYFISLNESDSRIALVMNLCSVFMNFSGLLIAPLLKTFSPRIIAIVGCSLVGSGLMLSAITTTLNQTLITYSLMVGVGLGILGPSIFLAVSSFFTTKKSRAIGFALAGTGFGQMILPQVVKIFLTVSDFHGAALFVGSLSFYGIAGAVLFHPVEWHLKNSNKNVELNNGNDENENLTKVGKLKPITGRNGFFLRISRSLDLSLLKDVRFVILNFGLATAYAVSIDFTLILPFFLQDADAAQLDKSQTAICMSVLASFDLLSRLTFHFFTDRLKVSHRSTFMIGVISLGVVRSSLAELKTFEHIVIACAFFGYLRALSVVNQILSISEFCSKFHPDKITGALGLNMIIKGLTVVIIGQFLAFVRDIFGSYQTSLHAQNILLSIVMIIWIIERAWYR